MPAGNRGKAREHVGGAFDVVGGKLFALLLAEGLRESDYVLDVGCGNLRVGRLLIAYLLESRYCGVEPEHWVLDAGIEHEAGPGLIADKAARFNRNREYFFAGFDVAFDVAFAGSVLSHTGIDEATALFRGVSQALAPDGSFFATFIEEGGELAAKLSQSGGPRPRGTEYVGWAAGGLTYSREEICDLARAAGFDTRFGPPVDMTDRGLGQRWVAFTRPEAGDGD